MISPCHWEDASIAMQLLFLAISLLSILMVSTEAVTLLTWQQKRGSRCGSKVSVLSSSIMQMISWTIALIVLYRIRNRKHVKFPLILRFWWTCSFLLSLARTIIDAHCIVTHHDQLGVKEYDDMINLAASICLLILSIRGTTGTTFGTTEEDITTPLLKGTTDKTSEVKRENPYGKATLIQLVTFSWLNPLFEFGFKKPLDQHEVPDVDIKDSAASLARDFDQCLKLVKERDGTDIPSIYNAIFIFARKKAAINEKQSRSLESGYLLALGFFGAKVVETITQKQWVFGARLRGLRLRAALISQIYKKGLILSSQSRQNRSSGEIINTMSVDVQRVTDFIWYLNTIWMLPVQISLAIFILHINLGNGL